MSTLPSYKSPPLEEVGFGCQFKNLENWRIPHTGGLWAKLSDKYPKIEHATPLLNAENWVATDTTTGFPLPRVWFINENESRLVQFQLDRFNYNWRKRDGAPEYPRYPEILKSYSENLGVLAMYASQMNIGPIEPHTYELSYINNIYPDAGESLLSLMERTLVDCHWASRQGRFLPQPKSLGFSSTFSLPDEFGELQIRVFHAKHPDDQRDFLRVELAARGFNNKPIQDHAEWYDIAHEWIVKGFTDITAESAQASLWEREA